MDLEHINIVFGAISDYILTNRQKEVDNPGYRDHYYHSLRKGYIIADDDSGKTLGLVKKALRYVALKKAGKVHEIVIDDSWNSALRQTGGMPGREAWNGLITAAYEANHGLLVIEVENIKIFSHCWKLKQLAKQENAFVPWEPVSRAAMKPMDIAFVKSRTPLEFMFDGNVLIVLKGMSWNEVKEYAGKHDEYEFDDMRRFYNYVRFEEE